MPNHLPTKQTADQQEQSVRNPHQGNRGPQADATQQPIQPNAHHTNQNNHRTNHATINRPRREPEISNGNRRSSPPAPASAGIRNLLAPRSSPATISPAATTITTTTGTRANSADLVIAGTLLPAYSAATIGTPKNPMPPIATRQNTETSCLRHPSRSETSSATNPIRKKRIPCSSSRGNTPTELSGITQELAARTHKTANPIHRTDRIEFITSRHEATSPQAHPKSAQGRRSQHPAATHPADSEPNCYRCPAT